jgi:LysR family transcriptional regulator for metE and metH
MAGHGPIELRHLRTLQALRDAGSVTAAAGRLHLTQSALSHQLRELEERLGCELFQRKSRPLSFNGAGQRQAMADQVGRRQHSPAQQVEREREELPRAGE